MKYSIIIFLLLYTSPLLTQDITIVVDEDVLNFFAYARGNVEQEEYVTVDLELPDICMSLWQMYEGDPTGTPVCDPHPIRIHLASGTLLWAITTPRFDVSTSGIIFKSNIQAQYLGNHFYREIELPVSIEIESQSAEVSLNIDEIGVQLEFPIMNPNITEVRVVKVIYPSNYYSTKIVMSDKLFNFTLPNNTNQDIIIGIGNTDIEYLEDKIILKQNITFN